MYQFPEITSNATLIGAILILSMREMMMATGVSRAAERTRDLYHIATSLVSFTETESFFLKKLSNKNKD